MMSAQKPLILLVCAGLLASSAQAAPQPSAPRTSTSFVDVALQPAGGVAGRFVDVHDDPIAGARATLFRGEDMVADTFTQADGSYHFPTAVPGVYRVRLGDQWQMIRVWDEAIRPPAARNLLTIVRQERIVRSQGGGFGGESGWLAALLAGGIGAGIGYALSETNDALDETPDTRPVLKVSSP